MKRKKKSINSRSRENLQIQEISGLKDTTSNSQEWCYMCGALKQKVEAGDNEFETILSYTKGDPV